MAYPYAFLPYIEQRFFKVDPDTGAIVPNAEGTIASFLAGTSTPVATFSDQEGTENPVIIDIDADGYPETDIFVGPIGYKFVVKDSDGNTLYTRDKIEDIGLTAFTNFGTLQTVGPTSESPGYVVDPDDRLVQIDTTGSTDDPARISLCAASAFSGILGIKNIGPVNLAVDPNGSDTIDGANDAVLLPGAVALSGEDGIATQPVVLLISDGTSAWSVWAISGTGPEAGAVTTANLPGTHPDGWIRGVTDADSPSVGAELTGGGSDAALVWSTGDKWIVIAIVTP
jgi:hypothetical protein